MAKRSKTRKLGNGAAAKAGRNSWFSRDWFYALILALAVAIAYQPVWYAGFVWDDDDHLTANPTIVGPLGFKEIWTTSAADIAPLTRSTFWLEHKLWGLPPLPYHLVNVLLHAACAILLWQVLRRLQVPGAWFGAALWALHPIQVESVAWISEMKNTESGVFFLLSILFFLAWLSKQGADGQAGDGNNGLGRNYALTLLFAALAMASKSSTVILPAVFCLCAWWLQGRWQWRGVSGDSARTGRAGGQGPMLAGSFPPRVAARALAAVIPVFFMSIAASALSIWTQGLQIAGSLDPRLVRTWPERLAGAGYAVWFYLGKLLWPYPLMTVYPGWKIDARQWFSYLPLLAVVAGLFILWFRSRATLSGPSPKSPSRASFFALAYFLIALLPVLGLFDNAIFQYSPVFDHLQYLAAMGPLMLVGAGIARLPDFAILKQPSWLKSLPGAAVLLVLGVMTWQHAWAYESRETLWADALARNPNCGVCYASLGNVLLQDGRTDEAIADFQKALEINPGRAEDHNSLGIALAQKGRLDEAAEHYKSALKLDPNYAKAHYNLGSALLRQGLADEGIVHLRRALEIDPGHAEVHNDLGIALARKGQASEAIAEFESALKIDPDSAEAHCNLGNALAQSGQTDSAIVHFQKALAIDPNYVEAHDGLGVSLAQKGQLNEASVQFQEALRLNPGYRSAQQNLARARAMLQDAPGAK